jgi:hypothetical protein
MSALEINYDGQRVILFNEAGDEVSRTTLGEFLAENPDLVVDSTDIMQMVEQVGCWVWDGGAGGVFKIVPVDFLFYRLTLDEWRYLRPSVRARLLDLMRTRNELVALAQAIDYWNDSSSAELSDRAREELGVLVSQARAVLSKEAS